MPTPRPSARTVQRCARLELEVASFRVRIKFVGESAFDVARARVVALAEVAVVTVHHPHELGEARRAPLDHLYFTVDLTNNAPLYLKRGKTYEFDINTDPSHPFSIRTGPSSA